MKTRQKLILMILSAFEKDGYADFIFSNLNDVAKNEFFKTGIKELERMKMIEDCTTNGYAKHIKMNKVLDCPDFLWNKDLDISVKEYLIDLLDQIKEWGEVVTFNSIKDKKIEKLGYNRDELLNNYTNVKKKIESEAHLEKDNKGYKIYYKVNYETKCIYCGETNPDKFGGTKTVCKECHRKHLRNLLPLEERLYNRSKNNAQSQGYEYNLDIKYIKDLLIKQNYKCIYSGIDFQNNFRDKLTYPTIDRIDSSNGYVKGNVCICTFIVNMMKNNLTVDQFKDLVTKIYNNLNNF